MNSRLEFRVFESSWDSWESLFQQAAEFANRVGRENVLNISHSCDRNNNGTVTVWYWREENATQNFGINQFDFGE